MARLGTAAARQLAKEMAFKWGVPIEDLLGSSRLKRVVEARRDFCQTGRERKIGVTMMAEMLGRSMSTVLYHWNGDYRERKNHRRRQKDADLRAARANTAAIEGAQAMRASATRAGLFFCHAERVD